VDRQVKLEGPSNFRDLGGLPVVAGGTTRAGVVYRSDRLSTLTDTDVEHLEALGIRHVFDLRSEGETTEAPNRLPAGVDYVHLPMSTDNKVPSRTIYERIVAGDIVRYGTNDMVTGYVRMLETFGPSFVRMVRQAAQPEPMIIHCTAGKDRTGVAAMLLLDMLGVDRDDIVADYALSAKRRRGSDFDHTEATSLKQMLSERGLDPADFAALWEVRAQVAENTLDCLYQRWSGASGYLNAMGLTTAEASATCQNLLIP